MNRFGLTFSLFAAFASLACSSSSGGSSDGPSNSQDACSALAASLCTKVSACGSASFLAYYGTQDACVASITNTCKTTAGLASTGATSDVINACKTAYDGASCVDVRFNEDLCPPIKGSLTPGSTCADDGQCDSGICKGGGSSTCGVCIAPAAPGGSCKDLPCPIGFYCNSGSICTGRLAAGGSCKSTNECKGATTCVIAPDGTGTCATPPQHGPGEACANSNECDAAQNLTCAMSTGGKGICTKVTVVNPGDVCDAGSGISTLCAGGTCQPTTGGKLVCAKFAADGAACGGMNASCGPGLKCTTPAGAGGNSGGAGVCKAPTPLVCN